MINITEVIVAVVLTAVTFYFAIKGFKRNQDAVDDHYIPKDNLKGTKFENDVIDLLNIVRHDNNLGYLLKDDNASKYAYKRLQDIKKIPKITQKNCHSNFKPEVMLSQGYVGVGEIVAWQYNDPEKLVNAWMNSPEHAEVILSWNFRCVGLRSQKHDGKVYIISILGH